MILKGLSGLLIGLGYGLLMGVITLFVWRVTHPPGSPEGMIFDNVAGGWMIAFGAALVAGPAMVVGVVVGLSGVNSAKGGLIGIATGLVVLLLWFLQRWVSVVKLVPSDLVYVVIGLVYLPMGLGLVGTTVSIIASRLTVTPQSEGACTKFH